MRSKKSHLVSVAQKVSKYNLHVIYISTEVKLLHLADITKRTQG